MSVSEPSVVIGHGDEVIAAWRLLIGRVLPQEEPGEIQIPATTSELVWFSDRRIRTLPRECLAEGTPHPGNSSQKERLAEGMPRPGNSSQKESLAEGKSRRGNASPRELLTEGTSRRGNVSQRERLARETPRRRKSLPGERLAE